MINVILFAFIFCAVVMIVWFVSEGPAPRCRVCHRTAAEDARVTRGQVCVRCIYEDA